MALIVNNRPPSLNTPSHIVYSIGTGPQGPSGLSAYQIAVKNGFVGTELEWLESIKIESTYEQAVLLGFEGTIEEWLESLKGLSAYQIAVIGGYSGTQEQFAYELNTALSASGVNGGIFITGVYPVDIDENIGDIVMSDDGETLTSFSTTTSEVMVNFKAITGHKNYKPNITVNGVAAELSPIPDAPLFVGSVQITLDGSGIISAEHEDGAAWHTVYIMDTKPNILTTFFVSTYTNGQTELKEDDEVTINITSDTTIVAVEFADFGALKSTYEQLTEPVMSFNITANIADRGIAPEAFSYMVRVQKENGAWSDWFDSISLGTTNGLNTVILNNLYPTISISSITYPVNQSALKDNEEATIVNGASDYDIISYQSSELAITNPELFESVKTVSRISGDYNITENNFSITATRLANGAVTQLNNVINIASVLPEITISSPYTRLRSGGNFGTSAQVYPITLTSNQKLDKIPALNAPEGTWIDQFSSNDGGFTWIRNIQIHDDDNKGTFSWNSLFVRSMSNMITETITGTNTYVLGGFVFRTLRVDAYPNRITNVGTNVSDTTKLRCTNLSKGESGSLNYTYIDNLNESLDKFTIVDQLLTLNQNGDHWYNSDGFNATSNTSGEMYIELEEVI